MGQPEPTSPNRLPLALDLSGKPVVVVGGGAVAERKVRSLLAAGAAVTVVAPDLCPGLAADAAANRLQWYNRCYQSGDLTGCWLAFAATDAPSVNRAVAAEAAQHRIWCNVATPPEAGDTHVLAAVQREGVMVALATDGASPFAARKLREAVEAVVTPAVARLVTLMGELRAEVQACSHDEAGRRAIYEAMWQSAAREHLQQGDEAAAHDALRRCLDS